MANIKGRGVKIEVGATYGADKTVTAVTLANPGVATSTSHGLTNDTVGYFYNVVGMVQLEKQACRLKNVATNTFELQGLDTTTYSAFTSGTFKPVATWSTLSEATSYSLGGGASDKLDATTLVDIVRKEEIGLLPVTSLSVNLFAQDTNSAAMALIEAAARAQSVVVLRITLPSGAVRVLTAEPALPGEELTVGALATGALEFAVKGFALKLAA